MRAISSILGKFRDHPWLISLVLAGLVVAWVATGEIRTIGEAPPPGEEAAPPDEAPPMAVRTREFEVEPTAREVRAQGATEASRSVTLRAETTGRVAETPLRRGRFAEAEAAVVRLQERDRRERLREAESRKDQAELNYEAERRMEERGLQARLRSAEARAELERARAELRAAELEVEHGTIRTPFEGVLEERMVEVGDFVSPGDPVAEFLELDPLIVAADIPEREFRNLREDAPGRARLRDGREISGEIRYVGARAREGTRSFRVELEVANPEGELPAGISAELILPQEPVPAHRIPVSLLELDDEGGLRVKAVTEEGRVETHEVEIVRFGRDAARVSGLPERVRLITVGHGFVEPGQRVEAHADERDETGRP